MRTDLHHVPVLALRPGDRVHERNADWPTPFTDGEVYVYTVADVDRINAHTVHVALETDAMTAAVPYEPEDSVWIEPR